MSLGQAAGHAVHLARTANGPMQQVPVPALQARLHGARPATIYVSDIPPSHADFATVQWLGTVGGLHRIAPPPQKHGECGAPIAGQYFRDLWSRCGAGEDARTGIG